MNANLPRRTRWRQEGDTVVVELRAHPAAAVGCALVGLVTSGATIGGWIQAGPSLGAAVMGTIAALFLLGAIVASFGHSELRRSPERISFGTVLGPLRFARSVNAQDVRKVEVVDYVDEPTGKFLYSLILVITNGRLMRLGSGFSRPQVEFLWSVVRPGFRSSTRIEKVSRSSD